jgi:hypothetical protein
MYFPERNLSNQYISKSYQDVVQQYITTSSLEFILDGLGNCLFSIPSASLSQTIITSDVTASMSVASSSYSLTSVVSSVATFADIADTASVCISSSNADTASYAKFAVTQSFTLFSITSSISSSWASSSVSSSYATFAQTFPAVLPTGSTQNITASWSNKSILSNTSTSASYATFAQTFPAVLPTGSTQNITSSWSNNSINAVSANNSNTSTTSSYSIFAQNIPSVLPTGSTQNITSSWALNLVGASSNLITGSTIPITSSVALVAISGGTQLATGSLVPITSSYSLISLNANSAITSSYSVTSSLALDVSLPNQSTQRITIIDSNNKLISSGITIGGVNKDGVTAGNWSINASGESDFVSLTVHNDSVLDGGAIFTDGVGQLNAVQVLATSFGGSFTGSLIGSVTGSTLGTASWAINAINSGTTLTTGSTYPITSSWSNNTIYQTNNVTCNSNTTTSILQQTSSIYNSIFVNYVLTDGGNYRAGNVVVLYTTSSITMDEICTSDIGDSNKLSLTADISNSFVRVLGINTSLNNYNVKYHYDTL